MHSQFASQSLLVPHCQSVNKCVKTWRVVVVYSVTQLVDNHIVAQMFGQLHQIETQRYVTSRRARAPFATSGADSNLAITKRKLCGQLGHPLWKICLGSLAELLNFGLGERGRDCSLGISAFGGHHPVNLLLQKLQCSALTHIERVGEPHLTRGTHRQRYSRGASC